MDGYWETGLLIEGEDGLWAEQNGTTLVSMGLNNAHITVIIYVIW